MLYRTQGLARTSPTRFDAHGTPADALLADFGCARELTRATAAAATASTKGGAAAGGGGKGSKLPAARGGWQALPSDGGGTLILAKVIRIRRETLENGPFVI